MKNIKIIDRVTKIKIDWYSVEENELDKELVEIKSDTYYNDCDIYVDGELVNEELKMERNLMQEWEELNKQYTMSETMSSTSDIKTSCFNVYEVVDKGQYNYDYIKQPFYYKVTFIRNENRVFCIPVEVEKKTF